MKWLKKLRKRRALERELADELAFHHQMRAQDSNCPPFGNEVQIRESIRDIWRFNLMETTFRDVVYALRSFRNSPGFAFTAAGSLAVGIAAVIAIFTAADTLLFRPLPYPEPDRLVMVWEHKRTSPPPPRNVVSPANYFDWRARSHVFDELASFEQGRAVLTRGERTEQILRQEVSGKFFVMLDVQPLRGRTLAPDDDRPGISSPAMVISYRLWQTWFNADDAVLGASIMLNSSPRIVVGVMPPDFAFRNRDVDVWTPEGLNPAERHQGRYIMVAGRLKHGVSIAQAHDEMTSIAATLEREQPALDTNWTANLEPLRDSLTNDVRKSLLVLLAAVTLLLAIACSNVANLLLARNAGRRAELAVRVSLGAGRIRLLRQLLAETFVLASVAGVAGTLLGHLALHELVRFAPQALTQSSNIHIDWRVIAFAIGISASTGIIFGLLPSFAASKADAAPGLKRAGRWSSAAMGNLRAWLIGGEVAISVVLLAGASLLFQSLVRLQHVESGINTSNLLTFRLNLSGPRYRGASAGPQFFATVVQRIHQIPGVRAASATSHLPFDGGAASTHFGTGDVPANAIDDRTTIVRTVMPRYFETMGIRVQRGRDFTASDNTPDSAIRFIVNEAFVRRYFPTRDPLSQRLTVRMEVDNPLGDIIGVVGNVKERSLDRAPSPTVYYVHSHLVYSGMTVVARTSGDPLTFVNQVGRVVRDLDPTVPVAEVRTMDTILGETYAREKFSAILLVGFSVAALLLAAIGIYGVLAYAVQERTREIGVRLAIGAAPGRVMTMVLADAARFVIAGTAVGLAGAFILTKSLDSLLFGVAAHDPLTFALAPGAVLIVATFASLIPAWRAASVDPLQALR